MILQDLIATIIILLWRFPDTSLSQQTNFWLISTAGQYTVFALAGYLIFVATITLIVTVSRPTSSHQLTIAKSGPHRLSINRRAVESNLAHTLTQYDLYNIQVKVTLLKNRQAAKVVIKGMLSNRTDLNTVKAEIQQTITHELNQRFAIKLYKLTVNLQPYNHRVTVAII